MSKRATADASSAAPPVMQVAVPSAAPSAAPPAADLWSRKDFDGFLRQVLQLNVTQRQLMEALTCNTTRHNGVHESSKAPSVVDFIVQLEDDLGTVQRARVMDARARDLFMSTFVWLQDCLRAVEPCRGELREARPREVIRRIDGAALIWRDLYVSGAAEQVAPEIHDALLDILRHYRSMASEWSIDELRAAVPAAAQPLIDAFEAAASATAIRAAFIDLVRAVGPVDA